MEPPFFFAGGGHGGLAAFHAISKVFSTVEIVTTDESILSILRPADVIRASLDDLTAPVGLMAGLQGILGPSFLAQRTILNVHYSLLPKYRGLNSVVWAMLNFEENLGWTVHIANEHIDDGPIVFQKPTRYQGQTSWELMELFDREVEQELAAVISKYLSGGLRPIPQDKTKASWVPRRNLDDCLINFDWEASRIRALFKALVRPYPLPAILVNNKRFEVLSAKIEDCSYYCDTGRLVNIDNDGAWIKCLDSLLVVKDLQNTEGQKVAAADVLRRGMRLSRESK